MRLSSPAMAGLIAAVSTLTWATPALAAPVPLSSSGARCTVVGTPRDDILRGTAGADVICGLAGNDTVLGSGGDDVIDGGPGNDALTGQDGGDTVDAGPGNDVVDAGAGDDTVAGGSGSDRIAGGGGDDVTVGDAGGDQLDGGDGDDTIDGGAGADSIEGGTGINSCTYDSADVSSRTSCSDVSEPKLVVSSVKWSAQTYDNSADQTISVRMRITDDRSGMSRDSVLSMAGGDSALVYFIGAELMSGTANDGIWQFSATLPQYAPTGGWTPFQLTLLDRVGHRSEAVPTDFPTFTVTGHADAAAPVVDAASAVWDADAFDNSEDRDLRVRVRITDDLSGVGDTRVMFFQADDGTYVGVEGALVSGTVTDGVWLFTGTLPKYSPTGTWRLWHAFVWDKVGHRSEAPVGFPGFVVTGVADTAAPVIDVPSAHWSETVFVNNVEHEVQLTMHLTDDLSGVANVGVFMIAENGALLGFGAYPTLLSGTPNDGIWQITGWIPAAAQTGLYQLYATTIDDKVNHRSAAPVDFPTFTVVAG